MKYRYADHVFDMDKIERCLPAEVFRRFKRTVDEKTGLDPDVADLLAVEIKKWSESMAVTHYTHWFLPLTGLTAGKQNTFLDRTDTGRIIARFSGRDLIKGEPDASSFPHGGMRSTFEARGYTAWDPASPVFISESNKGRILYIPSVFFGYNGRVLDKKTPLLRSLKLINEISLRLLTRFNRPAAWVKNMVGPEQEFFLVHRSHYCARPDLRVLGRVMFAARPPRGQQMGDHYFGAIPARVLRYLEDVEEAALKLGIPVKTRHNEVAPNQFEIAPLYEEANIAADHNQMLMDLMADVATRQDMACLFHEKPFLFFNGSGKHINWSLMDSHGHNMFAPGTTRESRFVFLSFLTGFLVGICRHNDLIQSVLASAGNELRLGGHEAPPPIISVYLGDEIQTVIRNLGDFMAGNNDAPVMLQLEEFIPAILHDQSDRNRTSPVAFTGNKFEFRMAGASASLAFPVAVINLAVADGLNAVLAALDGVDTDTEVLQILDRLIRDHSAVIYEGDNYNDAWRAEAARRGLFIPRSVPETIHRLKHETNIALFEENAILTREEIVARADIKTEVYVKTVEMELEVARYMLRTHIIPAALKNQALLLDAIRDYPGSVLRASPGILENQTAFLKKFTLKINSLMDLLTQLDEDNELLKQGDLSARASVCAGSVRPHLTEVSGLAEKIEERVDQAVWSMPKVTQILFR